MTENHNDSFLLGVNYWPRTKAMFWWSQFDPAEVDDEFALIHALGLRLVRIFLLWEDFQPDPSTVNPLALTNLEKVCDIAQALDLKLDITFFTGHMSGPSWAPAWMLKPDQPIPPRVKQVVSGGRIVNCGYANPFTDPQVQAASERLLRAVVGRLKDHPAVGMWNLGNEPDLFALPPDAVTGKAWVNRMAVLIRSLDDGHPITCGLHMPDLVDNTGLRVHDVFSEVDIPVMHGYPMYVDQLEDPLDPDFVPFLCALTSALTGKPTLMEEFGGCTEAPGRPSSIWKWRAYGKDRQQFMAAEDVFAEYIEQVLPRLVEVGALGAVIWCFADYHPELYNLPPCDEARHERFFGLVRPDGTLKPHAEVIRRFASQQPVVQPAQRAVHLEMSAEDYYQRPWEIVPALYRKFVR
jgi:endo-1,4-beta-mannosidase